MKTKQDAFNLTYRGIVEQGCISIGEYGCAYRGSNDAKCAVGHMIPDEVYHGDLEGLCPTPGNLDVPLVEALEESGWPVGTDSLEFYDELQRVHDVCTGLGVDEFKRRAALFAEDHGLEVPR